MQPLLATHTPVREQWVAPFLQGMHLHLLSLIDHTTLVMIVPIFERGHGNSNSCQFLMAKSAWHGCAKREGFSLAQEPRLRTLTLPLSLNLLPLLEAYTLFYYVHTTMEEGQDLKNF